MKYYIEKNWYKVIQVEGKIYWEAKSTLYHFSSNEPSSGLWGMILVMLNQRWMFSNKANCGLPCYIKKKGKYGNVDEDIDEFQKL